MKKIFYFLFLFAVNGAIISQNNKEFLGKTINFKSSDGVTITADLYVTHAQNAPFIILYHQAGYSRGEYREIAPKLNKLGFNCMAVDQRSGKEVNGIINLTHLEAKKLGKQTEFVDAIGDLDAAYLYVKHRIRPNKIIIWGSSYSAAITFFLGSSHYNGIDGILAFSPGEYFTINNKTIAHYASKVKCPVFITSAKNEYNQWKSIYNSVKPKKYNFRPLSTGKHGSKALWSTNSDHKEYWNSVEQFLLKFK